MNKITYVTGNYGKYISVKERFELEGIDINFYNIDIDEPNINDIEVISKAKATIAYQKVNSPVFVVDSGFYINNYPGKPGYPGAFVKRSGVASNTDELLRIMEKVNERSCYFLDCLTYYDGNEYYTFYGLSEGVLSREKRGDNMKKAKSNLWYVFIPNNCDKTLAQMSDYERNNRDDGRTNATDEFIKWYKDNILGYEKKIVL